MSDDRIVAQADGRIHITASGECAELGMADVIRN
jgi:hypothetical protein